MCRTDTMYFKTVFWNSGTLLYTTRTQEKPGVTHSVNYTGSVLGQLCYTVTFFTSFYSAVRICTPCWVVWGVRLTLLDFIAQTRSRYLKESFKGIDTVRNMVAGCGLFCYLEVYRKCAVYQGREIFSQFTLQIMGSIFRLHVCLAWMMIYDNI